jgi:DNA-binding transcriptional LysR family regulator
MNLQTTDWNKFRTFYHVAKARSFTKVTENLHICQPSLSRRISSLEESLNMRLLQRVPRGVMPTEEGKRDWKQLMSC